MTPLDLRCYVVTSGDSPATVSAAGSAAAAGAGVVQVRAKTLSDAGLLALVRAVADAVEATGAETRVLVDDRADVAWAAMREDARVHGVHLGQEDLPVRAARALLGPEAVIGLTTGTLALVEAAAGIEDVVDYLGAGPFRHTPTKDSGRPALGAAGYPPLVAATRLPIVAIGGVTSADVPALRHTGVAGVAVVREVMTAPDPAAATRALLEAWEGACHPPPE